MENLEFFPERHELCAQSLRVHERNKAALLLSLSEQHTRVPTSTDLIGNLSRGIQSVPPVDLNMVLTIHIYI